MDATPRRLVLRAEGLPARQADREERVQGPAKSAPRARPWPDSPASRASKPEDLAIETTPKGEYYVLREEGRRAGAPGTFWPNRCPASSCRSICPRPCTGPGKGGPRFIRPIRWLVALLGEEIVPFEIAGVRSGALTAGHRRLGAPRNRRHHRRLRAAAARPLRDSFRRGAAQQDLERAGRRARQAGSRSARYPGLHHRIPHPHPRQLRPAVSGAAGGGADHGDAPSPEVFLGGGCRRASSRRTSSR